MLNINRTSCLLFYKQKRIIISGLTRCVRNGNKNIGGIESEVNKRNFSSSNGHRPEGEETAHNCAVKDKFT